MTVKELIEALQALTPEQQELPIAVMGYDELYELGSIYGQASFYKSKEEPSVPCIFIGDY